MKYAFVHILLIIMILTSCRGPNEPIPIRTDQFHPIYIPSIILSDETGNIIGVAGNQGNLQNEGLNTGSGEIFPARYTVHISPNPSVGLFTITIEIPITAYVTIWMVKGIGFSEQIVNKEVLIGSNIIATPYGLGYIVWHAYLTAGIHKINIDIRGKLANGFYRIYVEASNNISELSDWSDILILSEISCPNLYRFGLDQYFNQCK